MKSLNQLMQEIIQLSGNIETNYPELHKYFGETSVKSEIQTKKKSLQQI